MWLLLVVACQPSAPALSSTQLRIYTFPEYIPDGLVTQFEAETHVDVSIETYATNEELLAGLAARPSTYDLIVPSDYTVERLIREDQLQPLELATVPNYNNISKAFLSPYFDPGGVGSRRPGVDHDKYTLPYLWGTTGIAYNTKLVSPAPTSWADLWRPDLQGHVAVVDDPREMMGLALLALGYDKNTVRPDRIAEAGAKLKALAPGVVVYDANTTERSLVSGQATIAAIFSGNAALAEQQDPDIAYVLPSEGAGIWFDNLAIPRGAPHPDAAAAFIDFLLRPESGMAITESFPYSNPNSAALDLLKASSPAAYDAYEANPATNPPPSALAGCQIVKDVGPDVSKLYEQSWDDAKGGR